MDKRLVISVVLVMASWGFIAINAQTTTVPPTTTVTAGATTTVAATTTATTAGATTTVAAGTTATTAGATTTVAATTTGTAAGATTTVAATTTGTAAGATTTVAATTTGTAAGATTTVAATTAVTTAGATTTMAATTGGTTAVATTGGTTGAATTGGTTGAATTGGTTGAATTGGTTGAATTGGTTAAATTNGTTAISTVPAISESISRGDCGSTKLCAEEPSECDPTTGDCFFLSAKQNGQKYDFELSGQTDGYIAAGLSETASQNSRHTAYICARDNNAVRFFTGFIEDSSLNVTNSLDSSNVQGTVSQGKVQCIFTADLSNPRTRASSASFSLSVTTGPYDASTGVLGSPVFKILTPRVNLSDPSANITNQLSNDTTSSSAYPVTATQSFLPALLVTVCMIAFTAM